MIVCRKCRVELEDDMLYCPLCGTAVTSNGSPQLSDLAQQQLFPYRQQMNQPQKKFVWEIVSIILFSGIIATLLIDFITSEAITWSEYPVAVSLVIFSYVSLFAFWCPRAMIQMGAGFTLSSSFF